MVRVVVTSGNLTTSDWSIWSNCLWYQDFPKKKDQKQTEKKTSNGFDFDKDFKETLESYLRSIMPLKIDYKSILKLDLNDYIISNIDIILLPSLPGRYRDQAMTKYGIGKVNYILGKFPCQGISKTNRKIVNYQSTSIGQIDEKYLGEFAASILPGFKTLKELALERKGSKKGKDAKQMTLFSQKIDSSSSSSAIDRIHLIYPTETYVKECLSGPDSAGTLFLSRDFYESGKLPKRIFHQFDAPADYAYHQGIVPHLKVFVITDDDNEINDDTVIYYGSHNFSPGAWGKYEKDFTQISIINSELGILIPPMKGKCCIVLIKILIFSFIGSAARKIDLVQNLSFKVPPKRYSTSDDPFLKERKRKN